jgi:hypothetical protein
MTKIIYLLIPSAASIPTQPHQYHKIGKWSHNAPLLKRGQDMVIIQQPNANHRQSCSFFPQNNTSYISLIHKKNTGCNLTFHVTTES